jgi:hypothetical protein
VPRLADDLSIAHAIIDRVDEVTRSRFQAEDLKVETKPDLTPVSDADKACPSCGRAINCTAPDCVPTEPKVTYDDGANLGFAFLGFLIPLVGLILYFVDFKNRPKRARCTGIASIIGFIFWFVLELVAAVAVALLPFILDFILRVLPYLLEAMFA